MINPNVNSVILTPSFSFFAALRVFQIWILNYVEVVRTCLLNIHKKFRMFWHILEAILKTGNLLTK